MLILSFGSSIVIESAEEIFEVFFGMVVAHMDEDSKREGFLLGWRSLSVSALLQRGEPHSN